MKKSWDPSRLVDAPSGWEDRGYGDMKDIHEYGARQTAEPAPPPIALVA
jgi:hypothetical protein